MSNQIQQLQAERRAILREARKLYRQMDGVKNEDEARKIERKFDGMILEADELEERIDELESRGAGDPRAPRGGEVTQRGVDDDSPEARHGKAFENWLRAPTSERAKTELAQAEQRTASSLTGLGGGYVVPEKIVTPIMTRVRDENVMRQIVRVVPVSTSDVKLPISEADATSGWVGETDTRSATTEPTLAAKIPTFGSLYANVSMTEELSDDALISVQQWFIDEAARAMAEAEMSAIIAGNGTDKPTGLLNTAPESAADGSRTANALKYIASGAADDLGSGVADLLLTTYYDLKAGYRRNATWCMNSATAAVIRKLKTGDGTYIWADSFQDGQPSRLLGHPVAIAEGMPDIGTDEHPILFGDFQRGYVLCDRTGLFVLPDPYTVKGQVSVYIRRRVGGCVYDENAIRAIKCAAS